MLTKKADHFFLRVNGLDLHKSFVATGGIYKLSKGFIYKDKVVEGAGNWQKLVLDSLQNQGRKNLHILIYIHGYLAENPWFAALSGYTMHQEIFDDPSHDVTQVCSFQWESGLYTIENRNLAFAKGRFFEHQLSLLHETCFEQGIHLFVSFLAHSMGNRVLEGFTHSWKQTPPAYQVNQMFLCAPDVPADVFEHSFSHLSGIAKDIHVLFHKEDKTLRFANVLIPFPRLGIYGNTQIEIDAPLKTKAESKEKAKKGRVHFLDVTGMTDDDTALGSRFSHHRYFYGSKNVVKYINNWLGKK
ncbi:MAG: alpha/beta hydrolase [Saprospiraceae bacterium]|nr:alpha/beta hydrolase [Saprospiraceae bacterium]